MSDLLTGKSALVTGSTSGIGRATAHLLAERGAHVVVSGRNTARGEQVVRDIRAAGGKADFIQADLSGAAAARELARAATEATEGIDILVNNAGIFPFASTTETSDEVFSEVYDVNVKAPYFLTAELVPAMADNGGGVVINVTTAVATKGILGATAYSSSKAAINQLTRIWAAEFAPAVRVNAVSPGAVETEGVQNALGDERGPFLAITPAGRTGLPHEIAEAVAYLASDAAAFVTGAIFPVDGGTSAI